MLAWFGQVFMSSILEKAGLKEAVSLRRGAFGPQTPAVLCLVFDMWKERVFALEILSCEKDTPRETASKLWDRLSTVKKNNFKIRNYFLFLWPASVSKVAMNNLPSQLHLD